MTQEPTTPIAAAPVASPSTNALVLQWTERIRKARDHWSKDFSRMRENMAFVAGYQWLGQEELRGEKYVANITLRNIKQKVSQLYAKNPKIKAQRRNRLDYVVWDEKMESLMQSAALTASPGAAPEDLMMAQLLLQDFSRGRQQRDIIDRVGRSLEVAFQWHMDDMQPSFKKQAKHAVLRAVITGVAYAKVGFSRDKNRRLDTSSSEAPIGERLAQLERLSTAAVEGTISDESAEAAELEILTKGLEPTPDEWNIQERLTVDFPMSTSVIVDPNCRSLSGFTGARWIAQQYVIGLNEANEFFGLKLKNDCGVKTYGADHKELLDSSSAFEPEGVRVCVWEVFDQRSKSCFYIIDGHKDWAKEPEPVFPKLKRFWPLVALTFNGIEVEPGQQKASIFPPSDVDLMFHPQKEWNRTRNELRRHRIANRARYAARKGSLSDEDKKKLANSESHDVVELEVLAQNDDISKVIAPLQFAPIDPMLYDTGPLQQDFMGTLGNEEAGSQPASGGMTATASTINEQTRLEVTTSNVDDLDEWLSEIAEAGGEVLMLEMDESTIKRLCGVGAVWPDNLQPNLEDPTQSPVSKEDFLNYVYLEVIAASSGRPNKALEVSNFVQLAPLITAAGGNPQFILREAIRRLDDNLNPEEAFPLGAGTIASATQAQQPTGEKSSPQDTATTGNRAPTKEGQTPAATVPAPKKSTVEKPKLP